MRLPVLLLAGLLAAAPAAATTPASAPANIVSAFGAPGDVADLTRMNGLFIRSFVQADRALLEKLLAPDFRFVGRDGVAMERAPYVEEFLSASKPPDFRNGDLFIQVLGDTAVVAGVNRYTLSRDGRPTPASGRYVDLWRRTPDGGWTVVFASFFRL